MPTSIIHQRRLILVLGVLIFIFSGVIYSWSILKVPLSEEFNWNDTQLAINYTLIIIVFPLGIYLAGLLAKLVSPRLRLIGGSMMLAIGFLATSQYNGHSPLMLYLTFGLVGGVGNGLIYGTMVSIINAWFPDCRGSAIGVLALGYGCSAMVVGNLAGALLRSNLDWRITYLLLGIGIFIIITLASLPMRMPDAATEFPEPRNIDDYQQMGSKHDFTTKEMVCHPSFWGLFVFMASLDILGNVIISLANDIVLSIGAKAALAALLVGAMSFFNGISRITTGLLYDRFGNRKTMTIYGCLMVASPSIALAGIYVGNAIICVLGLCMCCYTYGSAPVLHSTIVSKYYGDKNFAKNYSALSLAALPASLFVTLAGAMVTNSGKFISTMLMLIVISSAGVTCMLLARKASTREI